MSASADEPSRDSESGPKIVVDSDWKEQVAREKELAAQKPTDQETAASSAEPSAESAVKASGSSPEIDEPSPDQLPPPGLEHVVSVFFTQALMYLGQMPAQDGGEPLPVNKPMAKHVIDTLDVLNEKVQGNTTDDEAKMLQNVLHALRMAYVDTK